MFPHYLSQPHRSERACQVQARSGGRQSPGDLPASWPALKLAGLGAGDRDGMRLTGAGGLAGAPRKREAVGKVLLTGNK